MHRLLAGARLGPVLLLSLACLTTPSAWSATGAPEPRYRSKELRGTAAAPPRGEDNLCPTGTAATQSAFTAGRVIALKGAALGFLLTLFLLVAAMFLGLRVTWPPRDRVAAEATPLAAVGAGRRRRPAVAADQVLDRRSLPRSRLPAETDGCAAGDTAAWDEEALDASAERRPDFPSSARGQQSQVRSSPRRRERAARRLAASSLRDSQDEGPHTGRSVAETERTRNRQPSPPTRPRRLRQRETVGGVTEAATTSARRTRRKSGVSTEGVATVHRNHTPAQAADSLRPSDRVTGPQTTAALPSTAHATLGGRHLAPEPDGHDGGDQAAARSSGVSSAKTPPNVLQQILEDNLRLREAT